MKKFALVATLAALVPAGFITPAAAQYVENIDPSMRKICRQVSVRGLFGERRPAWDCRNLGPAEEFVRLQNGRLVPDRNGEADVRSAGGPTAGAAAGATSAFGELGNRNNSALSNGSGRAGEAAGGSVGSASGALAGTGGATTSPGNTDTAGNGGPSGPPAGGGKPDGGTSRQRRQA